MNQIRAALLNQSENHISISYLVPWTKKSDYKFDLIFSQAVLEHIININATYKAMHKMLKDGSFMSHQIDYSAHETHKKWFGHWGYSELLWKIIMKGRLYPISRLPNSKHKDILERVGFNNVAEHPYVNESAKIREISDGLLNSIDFKPEDLTTSSCMIISSLIYSPAFNFD